MDYVVKAEDSICVMKIVYAAGSGNEENFVRYLDGKIGFVLKPTNIEKFPILRDYITYDVDSREIMREYVNGGNELLSIGYSFFHLCLIARKTTLAIDLLEHKIDGEKLTADGDHPLHLISEHPDIVKVLIRYFKDLNVRDKKGRTPLLRAIDKGCSVDTLLNYGADPNIPDYAERKPIDVAFEKDLRVVVHDLMKAKANATPEQKRLANSFEYRLGISDSCVMEEYLKTRERISMKESTMLLRWIIKYGHSKNKYLMDRAFAADVDSTLFMYALSAADFEVTDRIIRKYSHAFIRDNHDHILSKLGEIRTSKAFTYLFNAGFKPESGDDKRILFDIIIRQTQSVSILETIMMHVHFSTDMRDLNGESILEAAVDAPIEILDYLLRRGFRTNLDKAFIKALNEDKPYYANTLFNAGADPTSVPPPYYIGMVDGRRYFGQHFTIKLSGETSKSAPKTNIPLTEAVENKDLKSLEALLELGKDPDGLHPTDERVETPLAIAARLGDERMVELLLNAGANPRLKYRGIPPSMIAERGGFFAIAKRLREHFF